MLRPKPPLLPCPVQDARRGERDLRDMQGRMRRLLAGIQARGPPADTDTSIAAHLLRLKDPSTGVVVE